MGSTASKWSLLEVIKKENILEASIRIVSSFVSQYSNEDGVDFVALKHRWRWKQMEKVEDEAADVIEKSCSLQVVVHVCSCYSLLLPRARRRF